MIKGIILIAFMVVIMVLMVTRKVPTLIAIPILAIGYCCHCRRSSDRRGEYNVYCYPVRCC